MEKDIKQIVMEQEVEEVVNHSGLKKGAVILAVTGIIGVAGILTHKFVIKPIIKKIKAKKEQKKLKPCEDNRIEELFADDGKDVNFINFDEEEN